MSHAQEEIHAAVRRALEGDDTDQAREVTERLDAQDEATRIAHGIRRDVTR